MFFLTRPMEEQELMGGTDYKNMEEISENTNKNSNISFLKSPFNIIVTIVIVVVIAFTAYSFIYSSKTGNTSVSQTRKESASPSPALPEGTILVKGFNFGFLPKEIKVKQGQTIKIRLTSDDSPHTFTIDELGVNQEFTWGKDTDISFVASKKGTFQFYCAVPGHKESGMVGTLTVE